MFELLAKFGLEPTSWTGHHPEKFTFYVEGCDDPIVPKAPVQGEGVGNPALDKYWPPHFSAKEKRWVSVLVLATPT